MNMIDFARAAWNEGAAGRKPHERSDQFRAYRSSELWFGWMAGAALKSAGLGSPTRVRMSRGYSVRISPCDGAEQLVQFDNDLNIVSTAPYRKAETAR